MTGTDPEFEKALDRLTVPAPRAGLIDDIMAAAQNRAAPAPAAWDRGPRDRRGGWLRGHRVFAATLAATIMSATAAAAAGGWLGEAGTRLPVIAQIATVMPDAVKAPAVRKAQFEKAALAEAPTKSGVAASGSSPAPATLPPRVEKRIDRIETRLDRRDARRAAMGLPANTAQERQLLDRFKSADTGAERKQVLQEARALRQERRAERQALPVCTDAQADNPAGNGCRRQMRQGQMRGQMVQGQMSPERRAQLMERLCARMAENGRTPPRCRPMVKGGPEPLTEPTPE